MKKFGILAQWDIGMVTCSEWCKIGSGPHTSRLVYVDRAAADKRCADYNESHGGLVNNLRYSVQEID